MKMEDKNKLRVITDYEKLTEAIQEQIKLEYPYGFDQHLISFMNREGKKIKGLRFETEEKIYLIRMTIVEAQIIIEEDDDFDDDGNLIDEVKEEYEDKYINLDELSDESIDD